MLITQWETEHQPEQFYNYLLTKAEQQVYNLTGVKCNIVIGDYASEVIFYTVNNKLTTEQINKIKPLFIGRHGNTPELQFYLETVKNGGIIHLSDTPYNIIERTYNIN